MSMIEELHLKLYGEKNFAIVGHLLARAISSTDFNIRLREDIFTGPSMSLHFLDYIKADPMDSYSASFGIDERMAMTYLKSREILEACISPLGETVMLFKLNCKDKEAEILKALATIARRVLSIMNMNKIGVIEVDRRSYYSFTDHQLGLEFNSKSFGHKEKISREDLDRFLADVADAMNPSGSEDPVETDQFLISKREIEADEKKKYLSKFIEMCKTKCEEFRKVIDSQKKDFKESLKKSLAEELGPAEDENSGYGFYEDVRTFSY